MFNFFKSKPGNRRLNSGGVLDVKLRSDQVRSSRMRALAIGFGITFCTFFCFFLLWCFGNWGLRRLVYDNPAFAITEIDARTDGVISAEHIRRLSGVKIGRNLMELDLQNVKRDLELEPHVRTVSIERVLPHTLRIRVVERIPIAQVIVASPRPGGSNLVLHLDGEGFVMPPLDPRLRNTPVGQVEEPLPVVTGINPVELFSTRKRLETVQPLSALELIQKFEESTMAAAVDLRRVDVSSPEVLVVTTSQGSEITFGLVDIEQQLLRWREIYEKGMRFNKAIASMDLAVTNNIPARFVEASLQPAPPPTRRPAVRPSRPAPTRRRSA